ncbi:DUF2815 family protein [Desulfosporosinus sp. Sb-LF]|uniref:DUF2815 family protein n=1 Tax=Desulfosporosinus sp. Sb-LF TaxID=2560027 RepID=UPI00107EEE7A|nr:DUF2815 family protein [Desulfosporosinus sp. Sb-LF]TGE31310.1 DUF2815 family protein [Desulfosporosinus sp. Sb-LF]
MANETKVITGKVRFSFCNVWVAKSINGGDEKYSVSLVISKKDKETLEKINGGIKEAEKVGIAKHGAKFTSGAGFKRPLRDGDIDRSDDENYANCYFINANSATKPSIVDKNVLPILDSSEVYSGCYGRASITFYPFNTNGNRGIACGLQNLQKLADGEPLGGRSRAEDDFEAYDDDDFLS